MTPEEQRAILATAMKAAEVHGRAVIAAMASLLVPLLALMRKKGTLSMEELNPLILAAERVNPGDDEAQALIAVYRELMTAFLRTGLEPIRAGGKG